jgi:hypothetical protein
VVNQVEQRGRQQEAEADADLSRKCHFPGHAVGRQRAEEDPAHRWNEQPAELRGAQVQLLGRNTGAAEM